MATLLDKLLGHLDLPKVGYGGGLLKGILGTQQGKGLLGDEELFSNYMDLYGKMPGSSLSETPTNAEYMNPGQVVEFPNPATQYAGIDPLQYGMTQEELDALHAKGLDIDPKSGKVIDYTGPDQQGLLPANLAPIRVTKENS